MPLNAATVIDVRFGGFAVRARLVQIESSPLRTPIDPRRVWWFAASVALHLACLAALSRALPPPPVNDGITQDQLDTMRRLLVAGEATLSNPDPPLVHHAAAREPLTRTAAGDERAKGAAPVDPGAAEAQATARRATAPVLSHSPEGDSAPRAVEVAEARSFGAAGLLQGLKVEGEGDAPIWEHALAAASAHAEETKAMFGPDRIEDWGSGGLLLSGVGRGGGGKVGDGKAGAGKAVSLEIAILSEMLVRARATFARGAIVKGPHTHPRLGPAAPLDQVPSMPLPRDTVARLARANAGRFSACQSLGPRQDPGAAAGAVDVAFVIEPTGDVSEAHDAGGDVADDAIRACVASVFFTLKFPAQARRPRQPMAFRVVLPSAVRAAP